ncbi:hypothetical protein V5P93_007096 [Actinokineospora auranticolor]|uniref:Peptidase inhibitor family I36 n=1 Tax=Actinokineospora auranticolor TaxID=155976 RepID=A0A2S6GGX2_9PSEU|nr:hypothetical protein [Actinokineospora auranticolor]PPK64455.1 hypothetical protein CLV40_11918 [Actinokineospora auranticolor]
MSKWKRNVAVVLGASAAAVALSAAPAQAFVGRFIYTTTNADCTFAGGNGVSNGVFASYSCDSGIAGYSLHVLPTTTSFNDVYINTFASDTDCNWAGTNGKPAAGQPTIWYSYRCISGVAGWSLHVTG